MKVLLDTNVVLDLLLEREPWRADAEAIAQASAEGHLQAHVCASSITDIYYISRKLAGAERARIIVRKCLARLHIVSVTRDLLVAADRRGGSDFEDDLQIFCGQDNVRSEQLVEPLDEFVSDDASLVREVLFQKPLHSDVRIQDVSHPSPSRSSRM